MTIRRRRRRADDGASAVEYGLLIFAIASVVALVVYGLGGVVGELFSDTCNSIQAQRTGGTC